MKRRGFVIGVSVCVILLALVLASCGESSSTTTTGPSATTATTAAAASSSTTGAANTAALDEYKGEMKAWVDRYDAELNKAVAVLETITDPMNATEEQIKGAQDFADLASEAASGLEDIQPPADLASAHQAYLDGLKTLTQGVQQYVKAMEARSSSALAEAMTSMSVGPQIEQAETALEQALGFKLTTD